ncbi:MAG: L-lysine 6-transaminase [Planctomycetota bacterium]|nr:MAG: L-lysine 6-transaminase [Planctomycetota bacterium]
MDPQLVHATLRKHQLADGLQFVLDLERSHGVWLHDAKTGREYLDAYTFFASWPVGFNHPRMKDAAFQRDLVRAAEHNPTNSDLYTRDMAQFVDLFGSAVTPASHRWHFWVGGGALAVENALKAAFDWKARKLGRTSMDDACDDLVVLHFKEAFHGRSGYTLSLTNTDPNKVGLFPKFPWPRVHNPKLEFDLDGRIANDVEASEKQALAEIDAAYAKHGKKIASIIVEPLQSEGGDNHLRPEFLRALRRIADERESLLIFDEVQTGFYGSGTRWLWQQLGVEPDLVPFGKKTQVCGFYSNDRVTEVEGHVFARAGRINSTWGGNLVDMVRCRRLIEICEAEKLHENIAREGAFVVAGLRAIARERRAFANVRGVGSLVAFTLSSVEERDAWIAKLQENGVLALRCGPQSVRFRLPLILTNAEARELLKRVEACIPARAQVGATGAAR